MSREIVSKILESQLQIIAVDKNINIFFENTEIIKPEDCPCIKVIPGKYVGNYPVSGTDGKRDFEGFFNAVLMNKEKTGTRNLLHIADTIEKKLLFKRFTDNEIGLLVKKISTSDKIDTAEGFCIYIMKIDYESTL